MTTNIRNRFFDFLNHTDSSEIFYHLFPKDELHYYDKKFQEYSNIFKTISPHLIHGDIKRANIMIDSKKHYIVDCETMRISYDIMNFEHEMTWALMKGNNREKEFLKGFFDGIYSNNRPQNFNEQVLFILIYNFFQASFRKNETCPLDIVLEYWKKCRVVFDEINTMDLKNNFII